MKSITLNFPDTLEVNDKDIIMLIATKFFEQGKLSLGQAAEIVGLSKRAFAEILGSYGVSVFNYPVSVLSQDIKNAGSNYF